MAQNESSGPKVQEPTTQSTSYTVPASGASWEIFSNSITNILGPQAEPWVNAIWRHAGSYIDENPELRNSPIIIDLAMSKTEAKTDPMLDGFRRMTAIVDNLKARKIKGENVHVPTYLEFLGTKEAYGNILNTYGLSDIASDTDLEQMVANNVSPQEMSDRISTAFDAVDNADEELKKQLQVDYPNLTSKDIVAGLLLGAKGQQEIQRRIEISGIKAEQGRFGMGVAYSAEELQKMGYTRADVASKYSQLQELAPSEERLAGLYGGDVKGTQASLEREAFTGVTSKERKTYREREAAAFAGASGIASGSLTKRRSGRV